MSELASEIVRQVVEILMVPVKKYMGYLFLSTEHVRNMSARMKQLEGTFEDVKNHKDTNDRNTLEIPTRVPGWLEEVAKIKSDAETISRNENGCFNMKARYQMGSNAWKTTQEIELHLQEGLAFSWTDAQKPLGRVYTRTASRSAPSGGDNVGQDFKSRATTFDDALKLLQQDQKTQVIALCGMGGVGKTTMMEQLRKVVEDKKMFYWMVKVVIGKQPNWHSIQQAVAENLGSSLSEEIGTTRADRLHRRFEKTLEQSERGILVILDDVWEKVELKDIGLSPLPNRVKLFLTSRYENICKTIAVHEGNLDLKILRVEVLEQIEAHKFFCQITKISEESDWELYQIGGEIVQKCSCLPLAIKLIAPTLVFEEKSIWKDRLTRLRNNDLDPDVHEVIQISYNYLKGQEDKEIFLLCGLFPEDFNIPIEDLTRYAWGLKLLKRVSTLEDGRNRIKTCVSNLKKANLLIDGDFPGCVKMHDLVLAFVLGTLETGDHASFINHGDSSQWSGEDIKESCKRLSLTCTGMSEFPQGFFKCPNLSLLKLMHKDEDDSFKFPQGFYENTEKLQVIAYERMQYPLLPRSLQSCSTNLRTLCLHECSLMFDISFIGDLLNLEVLSITECKIQKLPSAIGKLKKLKVLDFTGCIDLLIDDGVLKSLVKLEELYMVCSYAKAIRFTDANVDELVGCSNLTTLAIDFDVLPENISFEKLQRFDISSGCNITEVFHQRGIKFENSLRLVIDKCEILDSMKKLFHKVEVLDLELSGVNNHRDALAKFLHHHRSSFVNLRVLNICNCKNLRYLFTVHVAIVLTKLERLTISSCSILETVVDGNKGGVGVIKFQALKFLSLFKLPNLKSLYNVVDVIELPELLELHLHGLPEITSIYPSRTSSMSSNISETKSFLNEEIVIPNLEKLHIRNMENLKEIWPCEFDRRSKEANACMLKELTVKGCNSLVNLFSSNPMSLPHQLRELSIRNCGSIEALFNINLECVGNSEETRCCLRRIHVYGAKNLREVWRIKGANHGSLAFSGFQAIQSLEIEMCESFRNVFTPTIIKFDMRELTNLKIDWGKRRQEQEINVMSNEEISKVDDTTSEVVFSSNLIHTFHHVHALHIENHKRAEVLFEIETPCDRDLATTLENTKQSLLLPDLNQLHLRSMESMSHVWKCSWNKFLLPHKQQPQGSSSFHNLTTIILWECKNLKYLFSPLMAKLLSNLKNIYMQECDVIEEVVSNRDDEDEELVASMSTNTSTILFPHLDMLSLQMLQNLKRIGGGSGANPWSKEISPIIPIHDQSKLLQLFQVNGVAWSLCQYSRNIVIQGCQALPYVIPSYALGQIQKVENMKITLCESLVEVFETQEFGINACDTTNFDEGNVDNDATMVAQRMKKINVPQLFNLKELVIEYCDLLHHVFTFSTLEILTQLEKLRIGNCKAMEVIVKVDNGEQTMKSSKINLKELVIEDCDLLHHVFTFSTLERLTQLEKLRISNCKAMEVVMKVDNGEQTMKSSKVVVFPHLKSIALHNLPNLKGFFLGENIEFHWRLLDDVMIDGCPQMMIFTSGCSITPKLDYISTELGKHSTLECGLNFRVMAATLRECLSSSLDTTNSYAATSEGMPWSFHNLIEIDIRSKEDVKKIIPSKELRQLQKLEKICVTNCRSIELKEIFEALQDTELQSVVVKIPKLREVVLRYVGNLKYIHKPSMVLEFPNLTKVVISDCHRLDYVFSSSMADSLQQLQVVHIYNCDNIEVIVMGTTEEGDGGECDEKVNGIITLPQLKYLKLERLRSLKGFYLGKEDYSLPSLDGLEIKYCSAIRVFTRGDLSIPKLRVINTSFGRCELENEENLNFFINARLKEGFEF